MFSSSLRLLLKKKKLQRSILSWYFRHKRSLPWRKTTDPYRIWVSEIMLQQTQVEQVLPYYRRFLRRFPDVRALAESRLDDVLKVWEGMGYYRRARYLRDAARQMLREFGGKVPDRYELLRTLPGFGPYTCGAVLSIAFNQPYPAVDGNVLRVMGRMFRIRTDPNAAARRITQLVRTLIPRRRVSDFNQALMELGALICTPQNPQCTRCCWKSYCRAFRELKDPSALPLKIKKKKKPHFHIAAGIVRKGPFVLITKRPAHVILGSLWEFPGGKRKAGEGLRETCKREIEEELGIRTEVQKPLTTLKHHYSHYSVTLHFFYCRHVRGKPVPKKSAGVRWVRPADLEKFAFPAAHQKAIRQMKKM